MKTDVNKEEKLKLFASNLKRLREQAAMTKRAVATAAGIIPQQYYRYEDGTSEPGIVMAAKLAAVFSASVQELFAVVDKPESEATEKSMDTDQTMAPGFGYPPPLNRYPNDRHDRNLFVRQVVDYFREKIRLHKAELMDNNLSMNEVVNFVMEEDLDRNRIRLRFANTRMFALWYIAQTAPVADEEFRAMSGYTELENGLYLLSSNPTELVVWLYNTTMSLMLDKIIRHVFGNDPDTAVTRDTLRRLDAVLSYISKEGEY